MFRNLLIEKSILFLYETTTKNILHPPYVEELVGCMVKIKNNGDLPFITSTSYYFFLRI